MESFVIIGTLKLVDATLLVDKIRNSVSFSNHSSKHTTYLAAGRLVPAQIEKGQVNMAMKNHWRRRVVEDDRNADELMYNLRMDKIKNRDSIVFLQQ